MLTSDEGPYLFRTPWIEQMYAELFEQIMAEIRSELPAVEMSSLGD